MGTDLIFSLDVIAMLLTVLFVGKLVFQISQSSISDHSEDWKFSFNSEKRSLLGQQVRPRVAA